MTDDELIEKMARALCDCDRCYDSRGENFCGEFQQMKVFSERALAVARPVIEAQERERCARICDKVSTHLYKVKNQPSAAEGAWRCAAAIREGERE